MTATTQNTTQKTFSSPSPFFTKLSVVKVDTHSIDNVAIVQFNRPDKKNAMSFVMMRELIELANEIKNNRDIRAVILTGAGDDFCAGVDLSDLNNPRNQAIALWEFIKPWQSLFQKVCLIWRELPIPVIAVIDGHCLGAGLQIAMACDVRIASSDSKFSVLEAKWGLVADMGLTQSAYGIVPADVLKELAMTARMIKAQEAKELGLITHLSEANETTAHESTIDKSTISESTTNEPTQAMRMAYKLCEEIKNRSPDAVLASKRVVNRMYQQSAYTLYQEKIWQTKLMLGHNRKLAVKKAKNETVKFLKRQFS